MIVLGPAFEQDWMHIDALQIAIIPVAPTAISLAQRTSHSQSLATDGPIQTGFPSVLTVCQYG